MAITRANGNRIPKIDDIKRVILDVLADGRVRSSGEIRTAVATRCRLKDKDLELRPARSKTPVFTNWHAHGLKTLQNREDPPRGSIINVGHSRQKAYKITRYGRAAVRKTPPPPEALEAEVADAVEALEVLAGKRKGQGWRLSADERHTIERYAMEAATTYFEELGYRVEDVGARESYDLVCSTKKIELHVEVKGTTSDGADVLLTPNEVAHARDNKRVALFVYANISVRTRRGKPKCSGGDRYLIQPWHIDAQGELRPVGYVYTLNTAM
jgi:hypothetical protein